MRTASALQPVTQLRVDTPDVVRIGRLQRCDRLPLLDGKHLEWFDPKCNTITFKNISKQAHQLQSGQTTVLLPEESAKTKALAPG